MTLRRTLLLNFPCEFHKTFKSSYFEENLYAVKLLNIPWNWGDRFQDFKTDEEWIVKDSFVASCIVIMQSNPISYNG